MAGGFIRNVSLLRRLLPDQQSASAVDLAAPTIRRAQPYYPYRHFRRKAREFELSPPPPSPAFSSQLYSSWSSLFSSKAGLLSWYLGMIKARPILTKSVTASLTYTAADLSAQTLGKPSSEPFDFVRTLRMAGYGMIILGPSLHCWFNFVSKVFPKRDVITTLKKIVMAQILYGPVMNTVFFSSNAALQGENGSEIVVRLKRDLLPTMINGAIYWPICDFVTFKFIPVHLQPLVSNSFAYVWTIYMTYMASLDTPRVTD